MQRSTLYHSVPLVPSSRSIRVLDIQAAEAEDGPISGHLGVVDLEGSHNFTSLSYVWGVPNPQTLISCNGIDIEVTPNCHSALQHLRKKLGNFTIWVDAICINQDDSSEKSQQIPLMGEIYSKSTAVYIWLGKGDQASNRAMRYLASAGLVQYFDGASPRPYAAAWSAYTASYSFNRHPFPFNSKSICLVNSKSLYT